MSRNNISNIQKAVIRLIFNREIESTLKFFKNTNKTNSLSMWEGIIFKKTNSYWTYLKLNEIKWVELHDKCVIIKFARGQKERQICRTLYRVFQLAIINAVYVYCILISKLNYSYQLIIYLFADIIYDMSFIRTNNLCINFSLCNYLYR